MLIAIAATQFSPDLNNLDWGGSIITKIYHTTTQSTQYAYFLNQYRQVWSTLVQFRVAPSYSHWSVHSNE